MAPLSSACCWAWSSRTAGLQRTSSPPAAYPAESDWPLERQRPLMSSNGGSGGGRRHDQRYWLSPLPPAGPLAVVCAWPGLGIAVSRFVLDEAEIATAGQRAQALWPYEDDQPEDNASPGVPDVPGNSWIAAAQKQPRRSAAT